MPDLPEPGCYVDSHWGQYAIARVVEIAVELGRQCELDEAGRCQLCADEKLAERHLAAMGPSTEPGLDGDEFEQLVEAADSAEAWLNDHRAPEGYSWEWNDGDFGLYANEDEDA